MCALACLVLGTRPALAVGSCMCESAQGADGVADCVSANENACANLKKSDPTTYGKYTKCTFLGSDEMCSEARTAWQNDNKKYLESAATAENSTSQGGLLDFDPCIKSGAKITGTKCADVTIFVLLLFKISRYIFSIIGALAFLMFVYGGFTFILSRGNAEHVQQGKSILTSAVIGLAVSFGGYALVRFLGSVLGVSSL